MNFVTLVLKKLPKKSQDETQIPFKCHHAFAGNNSNK